MAIEYAVKYERKVDEAFKLGALTGAVVNNEFDWLGVEAIKVYSIPTVAMNDYDIDGAHPFARYGTPAELEGTVQTMQIQKDRSFTFTIDRKSYQDTQMTHEAARALRRQIEQVVIPEVDAYRIAALAAACPTGNKVTTAASASNAYKLFLDAQEKIDEAKAPVAGRVALVTPAYYNLLKQDSAFIRSGDLSQNMLLRGQVGEVDGVPIIKVPSSYFPAAISSANVSVNFIITNRIAMVSPVKLETYRIHEDAPGISGWLAEGRIRYDAFVLNNKKGAIAANIVART
jgi:N4-gp56 family major capsid protein